MARTDKTAALADLEAGFRDSNAALLTEYRGLTVAQLKQKIQEESGLSVSEQRLICGGKILDNDSELVFSNSSLRGRFGHIVLEHINRTTSEIAQTVKQQLVFNLK